MKRLGPELKMPKFKGGERKVPPFLADLYQDLRDRRLLPVVGLLLVAILATPILLRDSGSEETPAPVAPLAEGSASNAAQTLQVVQSAPGLRNYKKRLRRREPVDPFHQRYTGADLTGAQLQSEAPAAPAEPSESGGSSGSSAGSTSSAPGARPTTRRSTCRRTASTR